MQTRLACLLKCHCGVQLSNMAGWENSAAVVGAYKASKAAVNMCKHATAHLPARMFSSMYNFPYPQEFFYPQTLASLPFALQQSL